MRVKPSRGSTTVSRAEMSTAKTHATPNNAAATRAAIIGRDRLSARGGVGAPRSLGGPAGSGGGNRDRWSRNGGVRRPVAAPPEVGGRLGEPRGGGVGHHHGHDDQGHHAQTVAGQEERSQQGGGHGQLE